jgi:hypothetical protein
MDVRYHWLTDRVRQKQFDVYWRPGRENLGDYHVNPSGKAGAQIPQLPLGDNSSPWGDNAICT